MSGTPGIVSFAEALAIVRAHAGKLAPMAEIEHVSLLAASGRVLAEPLTADRDQPPFDRAMRDGFAVRAAEWSAGRPLRVVGQVRAGEVWRAGELPGGSAAEIMTGAPVPAGVDAVAMVEHAVLEDGLVRAAQGRTLTAGENIVPRGREARGGAELLHAGTVLGPAEIALAASCGRATLPVRRRPLVAIAATGDELVELDRTPEPHQIRNSNSYGLAALVAEAGGRPGRLEIARDTREEIRERVAQGRMWNLMLLSGGVSAGKYDLVEEVLAEFAAEFFFNGVAMQPGKPLVFGRLPARQHPPQGTPEPECYFFGLPGNPISTQVTFHCFVEPLLRVLAGGEWAGPKFAQATLAEDVAAKAGLTRMLPAVIAPGLERTEVRVERWQGSGDLAANARANGYVVLPDGAALKAGDIVTVLLR